jgi:hypothetical protein
MYVYVDQCRKFRNLTALIITLESCCVIIPLPARSYTLDLYAFKTMQFTNWQILMRHKVRYRKSATLLQDYPLYLNSAELLLVHPRSKL